MSMIECKICGNSAGNTPYSFSDYHLGNGRKFAYFQCAQCGCLQKENLDEDTSQYYPNNYYSFSDDDHTKISSKVKWAIRGVRNSYYRTGKGIMGALIHRALPCDSIAMIHKINSPQDWKILDAGCGSDALMLQYLSSKGYNNLTGVDPFICSDTQRGNAHIFKKSIFDVTEKFDLITFNHSFEHMREQKETLVHCRQILNDSGLLVLRLPTVSSSSWENDKELWPNLDAPRHLFLHSVNSISILLNNSGFNVNSLYFDSTSFQFWGKKLYQLNIPLISKKGTDRLIALMLRFFYSYVYYKKVEWLNKSSQGDSIVLIAKKS